MNTRYPILEEKIILGFLRDTFNENLNLETFIKPNKEFVLNIFTQFLEILGIKDFLKIDLEIIDGIENLEEFVNTFPVINIAKCIGYMVEKTGVNDFGLSDLIRPKRKRTQLIVSQLIGIFLDFAETKDRIFNQVKIDIKELQIKKDMFLTKYSELKELETKKKSQLEALKIEMKPFLKTINDLITLIKECKQSSEELVEEKDKIKKNVIQNKLTLSELEYVKSQLKKKIKELQDQCISNVDIVESLENKKKFLEELRTVNLNLNNDLISNSNYYRKILEICDLNELTEEKLKEITLNFESILNSLNELTSKNKNLNIEKRELICKLEILKKDLNLIEDKQKVVSIEMKSKFESKNEIIRMLKKSLDKIQNDREDKEIEKMKNQLEDNEKNIYLYESMIKKLLETMEQSKRLIQVKVLEKKNILNAISKCG